MRRFPKVIRPLTFLYIFQLLVDLSSHCERRSSRMLGRMDLSFLAFACLMNPAAFIRQKRDGFAHAESQIREWIEGYLHGDVAEYQMSAWAMAVCIRGMTDAETASLAKIMTQSGEVLPREHDGPPRIDKHSTGGLGDKISLVLAPLLASCGVHVPMISGRGLGITGGTLDKLEAIPGFRVDYSPEETTKLLHQSGCFIISASPRIAPADRRMYALRDVTGTVESVALITASILSKKLAASLNALILDVKVGNGAFMKTFEDALELAQSLCSTGEHAGLKTTAMVTDMSQPLGCAVGNAIEVNEAIDVLEGGGPEDVRQLTLLLCEKLLVASEISPDEKTASALLRKQLDSGAARETYNRMVTSQLGKTTERLPLAKKRPIVARRDGFLSQIDCQYLGQWIIDHRGGRKQIGDPIDPRVGIEVVARIGDFIHRDQPLAFLHTEESAESERNGLWEDVFIFSESPVDPPPLVYSQVP